MSYIEKEYRFLFTAMLLNFILFGITFTIIGATLPRIIRSFEWRYIVTGMVLSAGSIGYFVSSFVAGILLQMLGPKRVIVTGLLLQSIGLLFFAFRSDAWVNLLLCFLVGIGQGGTEIVVNFTVVKIERNGQSRLMNLMHAAFSIGAVAGPFTNILIMKSGLGWQAVYRLMAVISLLMAGVSSFLQFSRLDKGVARTEEKSPRVGELLKHPLIILSFLILFVYVGSELGVSNWISEYYVKFFNEPDRVGAIMVSIFWTGLLIGRLGTSIFYRGYHQAEVALGLATICMVSLLLALLMNNPLHAGIWFFCAGLGYSAIYPLIMATVGQYFKLNQGAAVGFAATGGGIGSFVFPFIMATIANAFNNIHYGFFFYAALNALMVMLIIAIIWQIRKHKTQSEITKA